MEREYREDVQEVIKPVDQYFIELKEHLKSNQKYNKEYLSLYRLVNSFIVKCQKKNKQEQNFEFSELSEWFLEQQKLYVDQIFNSDIQIQNGEEYLQNLLNMYKLYMIFLYNYSKIFVNFFQNQTKKNLIGISHLLLREIGFQRNQEKINLEIINFIEQEREQNLIQIPIVQHVIELIINLGHGDNVQIQKIENQINFYKKIENNISSVKVLDYYRKNFEEALLQKTKEYYKKKSEYWNQFSVKDQIQRINSAIKLEKEICQNYFPVSQQKYIDLILTILIEQNSQNLVQNKSSGFQAMIERKEYQEIKDLYLLLKIKPKSFVSLSQELFEHILKKNQEFFESSQNEKTGPKDYFNSVIKYNIEMESIIFEQMENKIEFREKKDRAYKQSFKKNKQCDEWLAVYSDYIMKSKTVGKESDVNVQIQQIIKLFSLLPNCDIFLDQYQKYLQRRFLQKSSNSYQLECDLIRGLRLEKGETLIIKIQNLLKDYDLNDQIIANSLKEFCNVKGIKFEADFMYLTKFFWDFNLSEKQKLIYPQEIQNQFNIFQEFIDQKYKNRKSELILDYSYSELNAYLGEPEIKYQLQVTNYQLLILINLNNSMENKLTFEEIQKLTNIEKETLQNNLFALIKVKQSKKGQSEDGILKRENQNLMEDFKEKEYIFVNNKFSSDQKKLNLIPIQRKSKNQQNQQITVNMEEIMNKRAKQIESMIMKVMKSKRQNNFQDLFQQVQNLVQQFEFDLKQFKIRIESLIERNYLLRDPNDQQIIKYIA